MKRTNLKETTKIRTKRMVATTDCAEKAKPAAGNKVSKPLMEKKRRARINQCLDELKSLLETFYSSSIRKRKLEKADILELTVKHLRNLQKTQSCIAASDFPDYQLGFRSCLTNVHQYLLMADNLTGSDRWTLARLSNKLSLSRSRASSTMDSGPDLTEEAVLSANGSEEGNISKAHTLHNTHTSTLLSRADDHQSPDTQQALVFVQKTPDRESSSRRDSCVAAANTELRVWRPW